MAAGRCPGEADNDRREDVMSKHPIDHDRKRDDAKVAAEYARIEREKAAGTSDPKVRAMAKGAHADETVANGARLQAFLKKDRQPSET